MSAGWEGGAGDPRSGGAGRLTKLRVFLWLMHTAIGTMQLYGSATRPCP
ncbi:MAG: hypothetical protein M3O15_01960 [Acidobacteriota bacterium]|nr:hypothetical protein [Acidobacteriota bacterium]